jgi:hypothetical protein
MYMIALVDMYLPLEVAQYHRNRVLNHIDKVNYGSRTYCFRNNHYRVKMAA